MEILQTSVILGVTLGLVYALVGAGLVIIYRTSGYVSFAQGDVASVALYVGFFCYSAGMPYWLMAVVVVSTGMVVGGLVGGLIVVPIERFGPIPAVLATAGAGLIIQGLEAVLLDTEARGFPSVGNGAALTLGPVTLSRADVLSVIVCVCLFVALGTFFKLTRVGVAMRAIQDHPVAAGHVGIPGRRLKYMSWVIAGGLAGVSGLFIAPAYSLNPSTVNALLVFGFATVVLGGFESILGAMIAGMLIGVSSNLVAALVEPGLVNFAVYALVISILLVRPSGLLGRRQIVRV